MKTPLICLLTKLNNYFCVFKCTAGCYFWGQYSKYTYEPRQRQLGPGFGGMMHLQCLQINISTHQWKLVFCIGAGTQRGVGTSHSTCLWGDVVGGATECGGHVVSNNLLFAHSEVSQLHMAVLIQQYVVQFQVSGNRQCGFGSYTVWPSQRTQHIVNLIKGICIFTNKTNILNK